ncbi:MAG TPA: hypothetical protein VFZ17_11635 [Acidimicrobiia bacterium]|nr:hypothetical protein [Acidimicrobiia bacterium]
MSGRIVRTALACGAALVVLAATAAGAADVTLPQDLTSGGVKWIGIENLEESAGCTSLDHNIATGDYLPAYGPEEAEDNTADDGFDSYAMVTIDGAYFLNPGDTADLNGQTLTSRTVDFSGVDVTVQHSALTGQPILRTFVALHNTTTEPVTKTVTFEQDLGSDSDTVVQTTSSGDDSWVTADRWAITSQGDETPFGDPVITTVLFGPGAVASPQTNLYLCGDRWDLTHSAEASAKGDGVVASAVANEAAQTSASYFSVAIPAGATRYLAFFNAATDDTNVGVAEGLTALYNAGLTGPLAEGLTPEQVAATVNWSEPIVERAPEVILAPRFTG